VTTATHKRKSGTIRLIGGFRLLKGVLLLVLGLGLLKYLHRDIGEEIQKWLQYWHVDPENQYFQSVISKVAGINGDKLMLASVGSVFYAVLFLIEGVGLLLLKRWAEIFTVIITTSFIPLEIYHLVRHFSAMKIVVIVLNAAIVIYLIWRLKNEKAEKPKPHH
jgi:uncharacterized membrane protein (DUF2068 family)